MYFIAAQFVLMLASSRQLNPWSPAGCQRNLCGKAKARDLETINPSSIAEIQTLTYTKEPTLHPTVYTWTGRTNEEKSENTIYSQSRLASVRGS